MSPAQPSEQAAITAAKLKGGAVPRLQLHGWNPEKPPLPHQLAGTAWTYLTPRGFILDGTGVGKTGTAIGLLEFLKEKGQLLPGKGGPRAVIVTLASSVLGSWLADGFNQFVPHMRVKVVQDKPKKQRLKMYDDPSWEVLVISYGTLKNDLEHLVDQGIKYVIFDEADALKNHNAQQTMAAKEFVERAGCTRAYAMSATPISEVSLMGLHSIMDVLGFAKDFANSKTGFERYYHNKVKEKIWIKGKNGPMQIWTSRIVSVKNGAEFKAKFAPYYLRRTRRDVKTVMPEMLSQPKVLPMVKKQAEAYAMAKQGYMKLSPNSPAKELKSAFNTLRQICTTTAFLDEGKGEDHSAKMDWIVEQLSKGGDFADEKAVIFSQWLIPLKCMERRLTEAGIGFVTITGAETQTKREAMRQKFWNDPECRVVLGTTAIEKSISLQVAKLQINIDMLFNPARHEQLAGRVQRTGSLHDECWIFFPQMEHTVEEKIYDVLKQKQGLADWVFDANSEVFDSLTPMELYEIVKS